MLNNTYSERRIARYKKFRKKTSLNLVSLMDIFTILVFFLLVNSSNSQQLPNSKNIKLPTSVAKKSPKETVVIAVTENDILLDGRRVALVKKVLMGADKDSLIQGLKKELDFQYRYSKSLKLIKNNHKKGLAVTIHKSGDEFPGLCLAMLGRLLSPLHQSIFALLCEPWLPVADHVF